MVSSTRTRTLVHIWKLWVFHVAQVKLVVFAFRILVDVFAITSIMFFFVLVSARFSLHISVSFSEEKQKAASGCAFLSTPVFDNQSSPTSVAHSESFYANLPLGTVKLRTVQRICVKLSAGGASRNL